MNEKEVNKLEALSPTEQRVYSKLFSKRVINTEDVKEILGDPHKSADYITNLREKGYLKKVRRGVYAVVPPNLVEGDFNPDKFLVAGKLKDDYYISYHSALELHGVAQSTYNTVWITTKKPADSFNYKSISYRFVFTKYYFGLRDINRKGVRVTVSDREKTFLDCVRRIKYSGGLEELIKSLHNFPDLNWEKLLDYLGKFEENSLYQKTGFVLDNVDLKVPKQVTEKLQKEVGNKTYYLDRDRESSYLEKWNLMVPNNFEELV
ncbi:type IV toxin-antitoxin system AbiEi family antitoxin domain-containing protein [Candidatus Bipolaricaulota bacterium]|nr:type IV toxin-antitoxin system AbiEi family antitoxin domain-containing protein [Candidatus Bipolaricaulota bacterium]